MNILENIKSAIFNILSNKMRTILTTLGIIIGITSVIIITAIGKGFENQINDTFAGINADTVDVSTSYSEKIKANDELLLSDVESLRNIENIEFATPSYGINATVKLKNPKEKQGASLSGGDSDAKDINKLKIQAGRFIDYKDIESKAKVCVIDTTLAKNIFGREDVVGESILATALYGGKTDEKLQIIGVYKIENTDFYTPAIYIPIKTAMDFMGDKTEKLGGISVKLKDNSLFVQTEKEIKKILSANHNNSPKKYQAFASFGMVDSMKGSIQIFTIFIGFVAGISLLVGGIGVMNIMLVTVTERTREIGIRKALGATSSNIKMQFLIEAIVVSVLGGILGIICGYIGSFIVLQVLKAMGNNLVPSVSMQVVIGSVLISSFIGIVFGVYPAGKAAKLDPIEALRYE